MTERSEDFRRFHESFFGSRGYGWEPDTRALLRLQGEERDTAEHLLIDKLRKGDSEAACGLGELRSAAAIPFLRESLADPSAGLRMASALALWKIERFPEAVAVITACLRQTRPTEPVDDEEIDGDLLEFEQMDAVCALGQIATPESAAALVGALDHPRSGVRYNAARALSWLCGHSREIAQLQRELMSDNATVWRAARDQILSLVDPASVTDTGLREFRVSFDPLAQEYILYSEAGKEFCFHPNYATDPVTVPAGDYLSGILGKAQAFQPGERGRIIPRLQEFLRHEGAPFRLIPGKHPPEPTELTPSIGGKIRFKSMSVLPGADPAEGESCLAEMETRVRYDWTAASGWLALGAALFGGMGFLGWGLLSMYSSSFGSGWHGVVLTVGGAVVGALLMWNKISR